MKIYFENELSNFQNIVKEISLKVIVEAIFASRPRARPLDQTSGTL